MKKIASHINSLLNQIVLFSLESKDESQFYAQNLRDLTCIWTKDLILRFEDVKRTQHIRQITSNEKVELSRTILLPLKNLIELLKSANCKLAERQIFIRNLEEVLTGVKYYIEHNNVIQKQWLQQEEESLRLISTFLDSLDNAEFM